MQAAATTAAAAARKGAGACVRRRSQPRVPVPSPAGASSLLGFESVEEEETSQNPRKWGRRKPKASGFVSVFTRPLSPSLPQLNTARVSFRFRPCEGEQHVQPIYASSTKRLLLRNFRRFLFFIQS
jgi:hypothetical protein